MSLIRVLVVDDHPAVRAGLCALLEAETGMQAVGEAEDAFGVAPAVHSARPDVVVMDYQLPGTDGISLCRSLRRTRPAPAVLLYTAFSDEAMVVPARLAGVSAIADKSLEPRELALLIRRLASGEDLLEPATPERIATAAARVGPDDKALLWYLAAGAAPSRIAEELDLDLDAIEARTERLLDRLVVDPRAEGV